MDIDGTESGIRWTSFLVLVLLVPIVGEVLKQVGPILLARMPAFDDMIDGLTFGVAAGAAFAAAETIVVNRGLFSTFGQIDSPDAGFWVSLILSAAVVKPIVYGAATGIAVASFSGLGAGYDGFKPAYFRGLAEALAANILFQGGLFFAARLEGTTGAVVGLVWGALIAAALVVRLRYLLHFAVLEAALEASSTGTELKDAARGTAYCPSCEMPLMAGANFCVVCGTSVRAGSKVTRARNRTEDVDPATAKPSLRPTPAGVAPQDNKKTALVVGAIVATILVGGLLGQVAAGAAADEDDNLKPPSETPITIDPQAGEDELSRTSAIRLGARRRGRARPFDAAGGKGGIVSLSDDVLFLVPKGFKIEDPGPGYAQVFGYKGYFFAYLTPKKTTLPKLITNNLTGIQNMGVEDLKITQPESVEISRRHRRGHPQLPGPARHPAGRDHPGRGVRLLLRPRERHRRHGVRPLRQGLAQAQVEAAQRLQHHAQHTDQHALTRRNCDHHTRDARRGGVPVAPAAPGSTRSPVPSSAPGPVPGASAARAMRSSPASPSRRSTSSRP